MIVNRTYLSKAFLKRLERKTYGLFRNLMMETDKQANVMGSMEAEIVKEIGPLKVLREAEKGEETLVVLKTFDPVDHRELSLIEIEP